MAKAQATIHIATAEAIKARMKEEHGEALAKLMNDITVMVTLDDNGDFCVTCADYPDVAVAGPEFQSVMSEACEYIHAAIVLDNPHVSVPPMGDTGFSANFSDEALEKAKPYMDKVEER